jgi:hypothetical protein
LSIFQRNKEYERIGLVDARSMLSAILEGDHHLSISQQSPIAKVETFIP